MAISIPLHAFETLDEYLTASREYYDSCLAHCEHDYRVDGVDCNLRLHYVRFDANKDPMFDVLAEALFHHITLYCLSARRRRDDPTEQSNIKLMADARALFRQHPYSGETGELLLYFLLETVLGAPQVVCKMELKTNRNEEVKGGDGIHVRWDKPSDTLIVYLGEAKLYASFRTAMKEAFDSIQTITGLSQQRHEVNLITTHFKFCDEPVRKKLAEYLDKHSGVGRFQVRHACLIGYNWTEYKQLLGDDRDAFVNEFEKRYINHVKQLIKTTQKLHDGLAKKNLMYEFFFLPFEKVQYLRDRFYAHLTGKI